jgi:hypothetical protein
VSSSRVPWQSTWPSYTRTRQVLHCPVAQSCGMTMPADNAVSSSVWPGEPGFGGR